MTFEQYVSASESCWRSNHKWRRGQAFFNVLSVDRPDLAERIRATSLDPFYDDNGIAAFLEVVRTMWDDDSTH